MAQLLSLEALHDFILTMHDLRHESLSRLFEINNSKGEGALSLADIINISGHKDVKPY